MASILDYTEELAETYDFESRFKSTRYGASVEVYDGGEVVLYVEQSYHEPTITIWMGDDEETFDGDWDRDLIERTIAKFFDEY